MGRNEGLVTKTEAMRILKKSKATIHRLLSNGVLVKAKLPDDSKTYITLDSVHRYEASKNKNPFGGTPAERRKVLEAIHPWAFT